MALINCPECRKKTKIKLDKSTAAASALMLLTAVFFIGTDCWLKKSREQALENKYALAEAALHNGEYNYAVIMFSELYGYKNSKEKIKEAYYFKGMNLYKASEYESAVKNLQKAYNYKDSASQISAVNEILKQHEDNSKTKLKEELSSVC